MRVVSLLETGCGRWGRGVASRPLRAVLLSLLLVALLGLGLLNLNQEQRPYKLWIPQDSDFSKVRITEGYSRAGEYDNIFKSYSYI